MENTCLTINQTHTSSTGLLADFQFGGISKTYISNVGVATNSISNMQTNSNCEISLSTNGTIIARNVADANAALIVNQKNVSSTGKIVDFQFGGTSKAYINFTGTIVSTANFATDTGGLVNTTDVSNASVKPTSTGTVISRNIADTNSALIVNQVNASSTGKILDLQFGGVSKANCDKNGNFSALTFASPSMFMTSLNYSGSGNNAQILFSSTGTTIKHNIADTGSVLTVNQVHASATGLIADFQFGGVSKASIDKDGIITATSLILTNRGIESNIATTNANNKVIQMPEVQKISTIVSNPDFTNQPTINGGGSLDASFAQWETNFYYVTLKDTGGSALPSGQFKLTATKDGYATAVNQIFELTSLATGNSGTLVENTAIDFSVIGASWKMRIRYKSSVIINLTGNLQLNDIQIDISGMINQTHYLYVRPTPFNTTSYITLSSVGTYNGLNGFLFGSGTGQTKKFIFNNSVLRLLRKTKEISAEYQYTHFGSDWVGGGASTYTTLASNGIMYSSTRVDINTTAMTSIEIFGTNMNFANGTEITIKELL